MLEDFTAELECANQEFVPIILRQKVVKRCHIWLPDTPRPVSAVFYSGQFYGYVKFFPTLESAKKGAGRLVERGNKVILTQASKGLVLWVLEQDARLVTKSLLR
ncbi:MAG: hypothetical protein KME16_01140 [Scytolyngbya sp. HA4215-MV1]|jgi:hypothetical protein|nr:hypothetical protein [Scytolyngbya sp. HA4215-MV1]